MRQNFRSRQLKKALLTLAGLSVLFFVLLTALGRHWSTTISNSTIEPNLYAAPLQVPPPVPWTAVASTGAVDEASAANARYAFTNACVEYRPATTSVAAIELRYNVVNTFDNGPNPNVPGWTNMELGFVAPGTSEVVAELIRVEPCTGEQTVICRIRGLQSPNPTCRRCDQPFPAGAIDFSRFLYYIRLRLDRNTVNERPKACTLRLL